MESDGEPPIPSILGAEAKAEWIKARKYTTRGLPSGARPPNHSGMGQNQPGRAFMFGIFGVSVIFGVAEAIGRTAIPRRDEVPSCKVPCPSF
jgi:hypothetical protein